MRPRINRKLIAIIIFCMIGIILLYNAFPRPYSEYVYAYAKQYEVDPLLVYAMMKAESGFDTNAISKSGAKGLLQIMNRTGGWGAKELEIPSYSHDQLFKSEINIQIGCWYIAKLMQQYQKDLDLVLAAYNAGSGNVAKWRQNYNDDIKEKSSMWIPFEETRNYLRKVKWYYQIYQKLYG